LRPARQRAAEDERQRAEDERRAADERRTQAAEAAARQRAAAADERRHAEASHRAAEERRTQQEAEARQRAADDARRRQEAETKRRSEDDARVPVKPRLETPAPAAEDVAAEITAAIERLPPAWRRRAAIMLGLVTLVVGFVSSAPGYGLPAIAADLHVGMTQLTQIGSANLVGQLLGAVLFGWMAGRYGRIPALLGSIATFGLMSLVCAFTWNVDLLVLFRALQGAGLAGEATVAAVYLIEFLPARTRGGFLLSYQISLQVGMVLASMVGLFLVGALPLLLLVSLWRMLPESPRWLAARGRSAEAFKELASLGDAGPAVHDPKARDPASEAPPAGPKSNYAGRMILVMAIWLFATVVNGALLTLIPILRRTQFNAPASQIAVFAMVALACGLAGMLVCALVIDRWGRRRWFITGFAVAALALGLVAAVGSSAEGVLSIGSWAAYFFSATFSISLYLYVAELFPTRVRALAVGGVIAWTRLVTLLTPPSLALFFGFGATFLTLAVLAAAGAIVVVLFAVETKDRTLEQLSP
jgi:MFS transporter, putative metabolite:H+ symporter